LHAKHLDGGPKQKSCSLPLKLNTPLISPCFCQWPHGYLTMYSECCIGGQSVVAPHMDCFLAPIH